MIIARVILNNNGAMIEIDATCDIRIGNVECPDAVARELYELLRNRFEGEI